MCETQVFFDQVGQAVQALVERARGGAEQRTHHRGRLEQAVCVDPQHAAVLPADGLALLDGVVAPSGQLLAGGPLSVE